MACWLLAVVALVAQNFLHLNRTRRVRAHARTRVLTTGPKMGNDAPREFLGTWARRRGPLVSAIVVVDFAPSKDSTSVTLTVGSTLRSGGRWVTFSWLFIPGLVLEPELIEATSPAYRYQRKSAGICRRERSRHRGSTGAIRLSRLVVGPGCAAEPGPSAAREWFIHAVDQPDPVSGYDVSVDVR